ncbi:calcium/sodium antiporter [Candidatus Uhrbacteria bacterium]|nr:calcium/sodium antiporter [Candidatus Uhrbacteria bacterium]
MVLSIGFLGIGIILLIYGARLLVDGGSSLAKRLGISPLVIGLTIVSFGTSAPELVVNVVASIRGSAEIVIGNVIGSNIMNLLLILGISAVIFPLKVQSSTVWKEIPMSLLAALAVIIMANDAFIDGLTLNILSRSEGLVLLFFFIIFLYYTYGISKVVGEGPEVRVFGKGRSALMVLGGLTLLFLGGRAAVSGGVDIARALGVSEALIGFTILAMGTSLPELAASAVAAWRKQMDIAVGNVIGSNIFNIFFILGTSTVISAVPFKSAFNLDLGVLLLGTLIAFLTLFVGKRHVFERWQGGVFVGLYVTYLAFIIARG